MQFIARLLHELGYKRVIGILDNDHEEKRADLQKIFPNYKFHCIPAKDIRTKKARSIPETYGLLDENNKIREEYKKVAGKLFDAIESEFNN